MGKIIRLTESQLNSIIKKVIKEEQIDSELQALTNNFNQKTGENVTPQEYNDIAICGKNVGNLDLRQVPQEQQSEARKTWEQIKQKVETTSLQDLIKEFKRLRQLRRQMKRGNVNEQSTPKEKGLLAATTGAAASFAAGTAQGLSGAGVGVTILGIPVAVALFTVFAFAAMILIFWKSSNKMANHTTLRRYSCGTYRSNAYFPSNKQMRDIGGTGKRKF